MVPAGTWRFGTTAEMTSKTEILSIKSKTVVHLCAGATLQLVEYGKAPNNKTIFIGCKIESKAISLSKVKVRHLLSMVREPAGGWQESRKRLQSWFNDSP